MSVSNTTREYRLSQWFPIIKTCRESGMTVKTWCQKNDVNEKQFYYWQRKLRETAISALPEGTAKLPKFVPLLPSVKTSALPLATFIPSMVIRVGTASIELSDHVPPELLASVLRVISHVQ